MSSTMLQQETQIRASLTADRDDTIAASEANMETNAVSLLDDINNICSQISNLFDGQAGDWFIDLNTPSALENGAQRGVNDLNTALHGIEKKRFLERLFVHVDVTVTAAQNWETLLIGELPSNTTMAVGSVTTKGVVVALHPGTFNTHSLAVVAGGTFANPENLCSIVDSVTHDPIISGGQKVWGLLQSESATNPHTATGTTPLRVQISFVRLNGAGTAFEAVPVGDIAGKIVHYEARERKAFDELTSQAFLGGGDIDVPTGATVTRAAGYTNQGATVVPLSTNATLDIAAGLTWELGDAASAPLFQVIEGSGGGTSEVAIPAGVDVFNVDAVVNDFAAGATIGSGNAAPLQVGVASGTIATSAGDMTLKAFAELLLDDGNRTGSTWAAPMKVTDTQGEWDALETSFGGELSLAAMLVAANTSAAVRRRVFAVATANVAANVDIVNPTNIDAALGDLSTGTFADSYDFYHNGQYLRVDAAAAGPGDVYPGTALASGQIKLNRKLKIGDTIAMIDLAG